MNVKVPVVVLALLSLSSPVRASDLWRLLGNGDTALPGGDVVYALKGAGTLSVNVGLSFGPVKGDGYTALTLRAFKFTGKLTPDELTLFAGNVVRLSTECFNIDPARGPAIRAFVLSNDAVEVSVNNSAGVSLADRTFGPLQLQLEKRSGKGGHTVSVYLSRAGLPGQAPWIKSCIASG